MHVARSYQDKLERLTDQLDRLRQLGGPDQAVNRLHELGPLELDVLCEVTEHHYGELWRRENRRAEAIKNTLRDAITASLPTHSLPGTDPKTWSWQEVALVLFRVELSPEIITAIQEDEGQDRARLARYVREYIAFPESDNKTKDDKLFQRIVLEMRQKMARAMLQDEPGDDVEQDAPRHTQEATEERTRHQHGTGQVIEGVNFHGPAWDIAVGPGATVNKTYYNESGPFESDQSKAAD